MQERVEGPVHEEVARWAEWNEILNHCTKAGLWQREEEENNTWLHGCFISVMYMINVHIMYCVPLVFVHCSALKRY